ncbi:YihY family inner membrane protein [uncultured Sphaerotilus sp.]|uniref:YihY family inner membrane protein n=1 Tax=uncultured Sphaerotilus sp. TaxID=474984 RepID=UPI0030CA4197
MNPFSRRWAALQHWPWLDTLRTLHQRFREDRLGITAGSLTFTTMISLVPLATVTFALFTAFPMFANFRKALEVYFLQNLVPDAIARPVLKQLTLFASKASQVGTIGLVVLVFTALALLLTIDRSLNAIWRVRQPRPLAQRVLVYWATATLAPLVLGVSLSMTSYAVSASSGLVDALPGGVSFLLGLIELGLMAAGMSALFKFVPNTQVRWSHAALGGVFVALGFELAKRGLAWYLGLAPTYTTIYGAFAAVPILLSWIYLGWVIVLLGAVIAAYAPSLQMRVVRHAVTPGWRFMLALTVLRELAQARQTDAHGVALAELCERLRLDPLQVDPVVEQLQRLDWVGSLSEPGLARHVLLVDPARTPVAPLVQALLLSARWQDEAFWRHAGLSSMRLSDALGWESSPETTPR